MQPLIALTVGEVVNAAHPWTPVVHGQMHTYVDAVVRAGGVPFMVPLLNDYQKLRRLYEQCNGLLLCGGDDIDPAKYGATATEALESISPQRDHQELQLLKWALADDKPVFGICRGMQLINIGLGGTLHQDIIGDEISETDHRASAGKEDFGYLVHCLELEPGSRLAKILGSKQINTNSLHHQSIDRLGAGLKIMAHSEDGVVEAIELPGKNFVLGVQSHPEALENQTEPQWRKLFAAFIDSAKNSKP